MKFFKYNNVLSKKYVLFNQCIIFKNFCFMKNHVRYFLGSFLLAFCCLAMSGGEVVYEGIHFLVNESEGTAATTFAIEPLIRTGAPALTSTYPSDESACYYTRGDNYVNLGALTVHEEVNGCAVNAIGRYSFHNSGITTLALGRFVKTIGEGAFIWNDALTAITFPEGLTTIGDDAFRYCKSLTEVTLPASAQELGYGSFANCSALVGFSTSSGLKTIHSGAFTLCEKLATLNIGASVDSIEGGAFIACDALTAINIDPANTHFTFSNCNLVNADRKRLVFVTHNVGKCVIPNGVKEIANCAIFYNPSITSLVIPASVEKYQLTAIAHCDNLTEVHCRATVPTEFSEANSKMWEGVAEHCTLYVPEGSLALYQAAPIWKNFAAIKEEVVSGVDEIAATPLPADSNVYGIDGRLIKENATSLSDLPAGIYIHQGKKVVR